MRVWDHLVEILRHHEKFLHVHLQPVANIVVLERISTLTNLAVLQVVNLDTISVSILQLKIAHRSNNFTAAAVDITDLSTCVMKILPPLPMNITIVTQITNTGSNKVEAPTIHVVRALGYLSRCSSRASSSKPTTKRMV